MSIDGSDRAPFSEGIFYVCVDEKLTTVNNGDISRRVPSKSKSPTEPNSRNFKNITKTPIQKNFLTISFFQASF
jgi:hypothetical protein